MVHRHESSCRRGPRNCPPSSRRPAGLRSLASERVPLYTGHLSKPAGSPTPHPAGSPSHQPRCPPQHTPRRSPSRQATQPPAGHLDVAAQEADATRDGLPASAPGMRDGDGHVLPSPGRLLKVKVLSLSFTEGSRCVLIPPPQSRVAHLSRPSQAHGDPSEAARLAPSCQ